MVSVRAFSIQHPSSLFDRHHTVPHLLCFVHLAEILWLENSKNMVRKQQSRWASGSVALVMLAAQCTQAFVPSTLPISTNSLGPSQVVSPMDVPVRKKDSELNMFMGSDGGILGVGTPEIVRQSCALKIWRNWTWNRNNVLIEHFISDSVVSTAPENWIHCHISVHNFGDWLLHFGTLWLV